MPQVIIREIDNTAAPAVEPDNHVVMVPITDIVEEELFDDVEKFIAAMPSGSAGSGYKIAKYALQSGLKVLVVPYDDTGKNLATYTDKSLYDIRFMSMGDGLDDEDHVNSFAEALIKAAATRGDSVALVDVPKSKQDSVETALEWVDGLDSVVVQRAPDTLTGKQQIENGYAYSSFFVPFVKFKEDGVMLTESVPGSIVYLNCFGYYTSRYPDWFAMAGSVRGSSLLPNVTPDVKFGDADIQQLQARQFDAVEGKPSAQRKINPICPIRPYGNIVWGNRTGYPLTSAEPGLKASSFLNIRHLCCDIKNRLYRASRKFTFEPNSDILWSNFVAEIKPLLEEMRTGQGIMGYEIIKEKTLQKATLKARIRIIPIEAVEDFDLTVEMTDSIVEVNG